MKRNDREAELGDLLINESVAGLLLRELAIPGGPDRFTVELGHHATVPRPAPALVVPAQDRLPENLVDRLAGPIRVPASGLVHHRVEELGVLLRRRSDVHRSSCLSSATA